MAQASRPTIVEKAPELRRGGHPVDLWGSSVDAVERMGLLPALEAARTRNDRGVMVTPGRKPVELDLGRLAAGIGGRHLEIMRGELVSALFGADREADCTFGDSVARLDERDDRVEVTFESGATRDFALVIGADGQHSAVRRIAFGPEEMFSRYIGGYICGYTIPDTLGLGNEIHRYVVPGRTVAVFPIRQTDELGVGFFSAATTRSKSVTTTSKARSASCAACSKTTAGTCRGSWTASTKPGNSISNPSAR